MSGSPGGSLGARAGDNWGGASGEAGRRRRRNGERRRRFERWRLISPTGARVISLRQLSHRDKLRVTAPSIFTTLNMACGFASVLLAFRGSFTLAAALIAVSIVFDIADGFVARKVGAMTPFGMQLDSLADLVSFGLAPAILVHTWALKDWPILAWTVAFFWVACAAFRLARFNVTIDPTADKRYFVGLASPGAAAVVMATVFALDTVPQIGPDTGYWRAFVPLMISFLPALAMVTSVRFRSFRNLLSPDTPRARLLTAMVLVAIIAGLILAPGLTAMAIAYGYALTPPLGVMTHRLRARLFGPDSVAPPRYRLPSVFLPSEPPEDDELESPEAGEEQACDAPDDPAR